MENQLLEIEELIADALRAGVTLYEKQGALAFKQSNGFPSELKARIIEHKAAIIRYFQQQQSVVTLQSKAYGLLSSYKAANNIICLLSLL
jgi:hypothetical protein